MTSQAAVSVQGLKLAFDQQTVFKTAVVAGLKDVRPEGDITVKLPADVSQTPMTSYRNPNEKDKPLNFGEPVQDAFSFTTFFRQAAAAGGAPVVSQFFEAGGYTVESGDDTTIATYADEGSWTATADNFDAGVGVVVELSDGTFVPTLIADYTAGTKTIVPAMDLPSASTTTKKLNKCFTITPGDAGPIAANKYMTMQGTYRALDGANYVVVQGTGGAVTSVSDINFEAGQAPKITFNVSCGDLSQTTVASLAANDFADSAAAKVFDSPWVQFADAAYAGGITAAYNKLVSASFQTGVTAERIVNVGDSDCLNNSSGYMKKIDPDGCTLTLVEYFSIDKFDEWQLANAGQTNKYIAVVQPSTSETVPSLSVILPNAYQKAPPTWETSGNNEIRLTTTWTGNPAGFEASTDAAATENQPFYILHGDRSA